MQSRPTKNPVFRMSVAALVLTFATPYCAGAATESVIYNFGVVKAGRNPQAALTRGPHGVYYGTTTGGGATGNGTVFALFPPADGRSGWAKSVIYSFTGAADGSYPSSGLLVDKEGALFGVAASGGAQGNGVAFKLDPPAAGQSGWTETTLHSFNGSVDGIAPSGTLVAGSDGVLYGSAVSGGSGSGGVVFSLTPPAPGQTAWTETALYSFVFGKDGISPTSGVFHDDTTGAIYGMTSAGGLNEGGEVYRLMPPAMSGSPWTKTALYNFRGISDGSFPVGGLVRDQNGIFYGVTDAGGLSGNGTVFSLAPPQQGTKGWLETVIYHFNGRLDGGSPDATPVMGADGTLYGTTNGGGNVGSGTVFALTPPVTGHVWTKTGLASFDGANGVSPIGLSLDPSGLLIGTTVYGGTLGNGGGTIFTLTPPQMGAGWTLAVVSQFAQTGADAGSPVGSLLMGRNGVLYGSAEVGGGANQGAIFQLAPPASGETAWHETLLHSFNGTNGSGAIGKLLQGANGVLYGVTSEGGPKSATPYGVVYALSPPAVGSSTWSEQILHVFTGVSAGDGAFPASGLIADSAGALYGTAGSGGVATSDNSFGNGIVFKLTPPASGQGAWKETVLYRFTGPDGSAPQGALLLDSTGALYGTTYTGGSAGEGTVFKLSPPAPGSQLWSETVLHSFDVSVGGDGAIPGAEQLVSDADGVLYGTANQGGANNVGAVFALAPPSGGGTGWSETIIHSFAGTDGAGPFAGLLLKGSGTLYGVTPQGGNPNQCQSPFGSGCGTVFKLVRPSAGTAWKAQVLHSFDPAYGQDGADAAGALIKDNKGNLFGTTASGGFGGNGTVFEISP